MKAFPVLAVALFVAVSFTFSELAEAGRLGGGRSMGTQRQSIAPPASSPSGAATNPVMPAQPGAGIGAKPMAPAAAPATGMSRWLGPIAGLAAGLGLAALLSHFGLSEGFASVLLLALVIGAVFLVVRLFLARREAPKQPLRYAGATALGTASDVDASRFPDPRRSLDGASGVAIEPVMRAPVPSANFAKPLPAGFDAPSFVRQAKLQFGRLQAAYDSGDRNALADVMTPEMLSEVARDLDGRGRQLPTEIVTLNAEVLEVATENGRYWTSVRFTGSVREDGAPVPNALDEVWNLTKPVDGSSGWLLAGIQQVA
jgi:predicted lipid-binding transport protein (Tim44 family)